MGLVAFCVLFGEGAVADWSAVYLRDAAEAGPALAAAAIGSFVAGTVATLILVLFAPPLARVALTFGSAEFFALVVLGLIASIALAHGSTIKALAMIVLGLLFGTIGQDIYTGTPRFPSAFASCSRASTSCRSRSECSASPRSCATWRTRRRVRR